MTAARNKTAAEPGPNGRAGHVERAIFVPLSKGKGVAALRKIGLVAAAVPMNSQEFEAFRGREVVIVNDAAGDYAATISKVLAGVASSVKVVDLGEGVAAWLAAGGSVLRLKEMAFQAAAVTERLPPDDDDGDGHGDGFESDEDREASRKAAEEEARRPPKPLSLGSLVKLYPGLRPPVIHDLLRQGETMNVIATSKTGKSWLVTDLALAQATGGTWLGSFQTVQGDVLILDNELHGETCSDRIRKVAAARGIALEGVGERIFVQLLRGGLRDVFSLRDYFGQFRRGQFALVILDTLYRMLPPGVSENDNAAMASVYNALDAYAAALGACFVAIHHSSKGAQADKTVTDVGAGAGSLSRAVDTHLVLRPHEQDGAFVLEAALRSWAPLPPRCLRWEFPLWQPADGLDPNLLKRPEQQKRNAKEAKGKADDAALLAKLDELDPDREGYGRRQLQKELGWHHNRISDSIDRLHDVGELDLCSVPYTSGKGKESGCLGVKRRPPLS